ncbi:MAG TPA: acyl-CoA reductase [Chitinophagaceae bacterium]|nr:acyl-CoA reductase [Chitinophagaceae bacterium]
MNLPHRIELLTRLGEYLLGEAPAWLEAKERAGQENSWFTPEFTDLAVHRIATGFLAEQILCDWTGRYELPGEQAAPRTVGIVMAGNIPLVGFHDFLCGFISGHRLVLKPSSRDQVLIRHLVSTLAAWDPEVARLVSFSDQLRGCDAYIATGSSNTSRYFDYYFAKYPHIIRRNRSSVAVLEGSESQEDLERLADDVYQYFGLGCRNVSQLYVPEGYDFLPLLEAFRKYQYLTEHHKYKNNYDYNLALHLLNKRYYMTNGSILLVESAAVFSPISQLNYAFYAEAGSLQEDLQNLADIQCVIGKGGLPFGSAQSPSVDDYADGVDTLAFLKSL